MSVGIIVGSMLQLPAFFRHIGSPINAWLGTFAGRTHAVNFTTKFATRRPVSEIHLSRNYRQSGYVQAELKDENKIHEKPAIDFIICHPTLPHQGDPAFSWPLGRRTERA